jgi:hypothetical protein
MDTLLSGTHLIITMLPLDGSPIRGPIIRVVIQRDGIAIKLLVKDGTPPTSEASREKIRNNDRYIM